MGKTHLTIKDKPGFELDGEILPPIPSSLCNVSYDESTFVEKDPTCQICQKMAAKRSKCE